MSITATPLLALDLGDRVTPASGPRAGIRYIVTKTPRNAREVNYTAHPVDANDRADLTAQGIRGPVRAFRKLDGAATPAAPAVAEFVPYLPPLMPGQIVTAGHAMRMRGGATVAPGTALVVLREGTRDSYSVAVAGDDSGMYWRGVARAGLTAIPASRVTVTIRPE